MIRGIFLSLLIHTLLITFIFYISSYNKIFATKKNPKVISLSFVKLEKIKNTQKVVKESNKEQIQKIKQEILPKKKKENLSKLRKDINTKKINRVRKKIIHKRRVKKKYVKKSRKKRKIRKKIYKKRYIKKIDKFTKISPLSHSTNNTKPKVSSYQTNYINKNISKIYKAIQRVKRYPSLAKRLKKEGDVHTCFTILPTKEVINITTTGASKILQKGAYQTILDAKVEFPTPSSKINICLNIKYRLERY